MSYIYECILSDEEIMAISNNGCGNHGISALYTGMLNC